MNKPASNPIPITGLSCLSSLGEDPEMWLAAAAEGEPAFDEVTLPPRPESWLAATMPDYEVAPLLDTRKAYLDRHTALLLGAFSLALRSAGLDRESLPGNRAGLAVGSAWGGLGTLATYFTDLLRKGPKFAKPILFPHTYANTAAAMSAIEWAIQGPHEVYASGNLASAQAIIAAADCLERDQADLMFCGGCEALSAPVCLALAEQGRLIPGLEPETAPAPFTAGGNSIVPGEGAAVLLLEKPESLAARGAKPLGWLLGSALAGNGLAGACLKALDNANLKAGEIDAIYVSAAGLSSEDEAEMAALQETFGQDGLPPLVALAGLQGDCLGAGTALHCAGALLCLRDNWLPALDGRQELSPGPHRALITAQEGNQAAALIVASDL